MPIEPLKLWKGVESSQHLDTGKGHPIRYRSFDTMAVSRTLHVVLLVAVITTVGATSKPESSCQVFQSGKTDALQWHPHSPPSSHFRVYFRVAAVSDVQIVLADGDDDDSDRIIITIGGDGNSKTSIRRPRQSAEESKTTLKELVCDYFNPYWVQFEPSSVKVGRGGKNIALLKLDLDPGQPIYPSFLGYGTSVNSVGLFIFEDFEDQWVDPCLSNPCLHGTCEPYEGEDFYWCECDHGYFGDNCETKDGEHTEWKQTEWEETRWEEEKTFQVTGHSEEIIITKEVDISLTQEFDIEKDDPVFIILHSQGTELIEIEVVKKAVYILNSLHLRLKSADLPQWCWQMKSLKLLLKFVQSGFDVYTRSSTETVLIIEYRKPAQRVFTVGSIGFMSKSIKTTTLIYKRTHVSLRELGSTGHQTSTSSKQDPCDSNPCVHGECHSRPNGGYRCQCKQGYTGDKCEIEPDPCNSSPCVHGECHSRPNGGYRCQCKPGYSGNKCEIEPDPCDSSPCVHGECHSRPNGGYWCQCKPGYSGNKCEIEPDPCDSSPCVHGECRSRPNGGYRCQCKPGYSGSKCEIEPDPCDSNPCVHGVCHSRPNGGYRCQCKQGYSGNKCEIEPDPCDSSPCVHGECHSRPNGGYRCQCKPGYSGNKCEIEPNPCDSNPCVHGVCHSRPNGGYRCQCKQGYSGNKCEIEPDPCGSNPCVHGECHSRPNGGYRCQCKHGYSGNKCEIEPDPCSSSPCVHGECHSRPNGGYRCQCKPGYSGDKCEIEPGSQIVSTAFSIVGKPTEQSTTLNPRFKADKAVDGSPSARLLPDNTCTHTEADKPNPWWRVDLEEEHCISKIRILNRGDCCSERLKGAVVRAGDSTTITDNPTCGSPVTAKQAQPLGSTIEFTCEPAFRARYVSVDIPGRATLQLCEVTVEEIHLSQCPACPDTQCSLNCPGGFERDANGCQMCDCVEISEDDEEEEPDKEGKVFQTDGGSHELIISREVNRKLEQEFVIDRNDPLEFTLLSSSGNIKIVTLITHLEVQNDKGMKLNSVKFPNWCMSHKKLKFAVDFITTGFKLLIITSSGEERLLTKYIKKSNEKFTCESLKLKAQKKKRCKVEYKPRRRCRGKYGKYLKKKHGKRRESHLKKKHGSSSSSGRKKHHKKKSHLKKKHGSSSSSGKKKHHKKKSHWKKRHGSSSSGRKKHRKTVKKYRKKRYRRRSGSGSD